uniref:Uncharacterized protein n=1 Tax=Anguilla anguilla TaxID=7936 RepID=A0A0E9S4Q4_ANGAN
MSLFRESHLIGRFRLWLVTSGSRVCCVVYKDCSV